MFFLELGLRGKKAIVTGADMGIGKNIAMDLAVEGAEVLICSGNKKQLELVKNEILEKGGRCDFFVIDGKIKNEVYSAVNLIREKFGSVDILINNTDCIKELKPFCEIEEEEMVDIISLNLYIVFYFTRAVIPLLKESKSGRIINISSLSGKEPGINMACHNLCKSAVINLTKSLSRELAPYKILVNSVSPGPVYTPGWENLCHGLSEKLGIEIQDIMHIFANNLIPLGRIAEPQEISPLVVFLASEKASYITGANICIDGGVSSSIF